MPINIRPPELEVPEDNPFQNDLLDRRPYIETLTNLLGTLEGSCVFSLDSKWGGGKTTFLNMWAAHLRNEDYSVAQFNAWETDFTGDPFVALSSKLYEHFSERADDDQTKVERYMQAAKKFAIQSTPFMIGLATLAATGSGALSGELAAQIESFAEKRLAGFSENQESIEDFRNTLKEEVSELYDSDSSRPLFIMIDELDRCRPSYAIELLEVAKHLFSVDRVVFVLAVNRLELAHSVRALYGTKFDAVGYLQRFVDLEYVLPSPDRELFVLQAMDDTGLDAFFLEQSEPLQSVPRMIARLLALSNLDLRRIAQAVRRLALICSTLDASAASAAAGTCVLLILHYLEPKAYKQFSEGVINDEDLSKIMFKHGELMKIRNTPEGWLFDAMLCQIWVELTNKVQPRFVSWENSPLYQSHAIVIDKARRRFDQAAEQGKTPSLGKEENIEIELAEKVMDASLALQAYAAEFQFEVAMRRIDHLTSE